MTYKEIEKKYTDTKVVAEAQYDYTKVLESALQQNGITSEEIQEVFERLQGQKYEDFKVSRRLHLGDIMTAVCNYYKIESRHIFSKKRDRPYARPRQVICYIAKFHIPDVTLKGIGRYLGNRDHSTVIHSVRSVSDEMSYNKRFEREVNEIIEILKK